MSENISQLDEDKENVRNPEEYSEEPPLNVAAVEPEPIIRQTAVRVLHQDKSTRRGMS